MKGEIMPWAQGRGGRPIEMIQPTAKMVDFRAIADNLAQLRRYAGAAEKPVSVALHTLIVFEAAEDRDKPHALIHDGHEAHIGEITTPAAQALAMLAWLNGDRERHVERALTALKEVQDKAIHEAAGLPMPDAARRLRLRKADLIALQTERRDFLSECRRPWAPEIEALSPLRKRFRLRSDPDTADELWSKFCRYLPALAAKAA